MEFYNKNYILKYKKYKITATIFISKAQPKKSLSQLDNYWKTPEIHPTGFSSYLQAQQLSVQGYRHH
ncbi:hypothetical protein D3C81_607870 [compost metagenome]